MTPTIGMEINAIVRRGQPLPPETLQGFRLNAEALPPFEAEWAATLLQTLLFDDPHMATPHPPGRRAHFREFAAARD